IALLVIAGSCRTSARLRNHYRATVHETYDGRLMKNVLVVSGKEKRAMAAKRATDGKTELMLLVARLEVQRRIARVEAAIAEIIKPRAVKLVGAGLRHHIDHSTTGASGISRNRIR